MHLGKGNFFGPGFLARFGMWVKNRIFSMVTRSGNQVTRSGNPIIRL